MSNTITIDKKAYQELLKKQAGIEAEVSTLKEAVLELSKNEIKPAVTRRLERQSRILDNGGGKRFPNLKGLKIYLKNL